MVLGKTQEVGPGLNSMTTVLRRSEQTSLSCLGSRTSDLVSRTSGLGSWLRVDMVMLDSNNFSNILSVQVPLETVLASSGCDPGAGTVKRNKTPTAYMLV